MENLAGLADAMFLFQLFQSGLIFVALVVGLLCFGHVVYCRAIICRSSALFLILITTGFLHLVACVYLLQISERSSYLEFPRGGHKHCMDYFLPAVLANSVLFIAIVHSIIRQNVQSKLLSSIVWVWSAASILIGYYLIIRSSADYPPWLQQDTFFTIGKDTDVHLNVFWSVCEKNVDSEKFRLLAEYGLVYFPVIIIVAYAWRKAYKETGDMSPLNIRVLDAQCCKYEPEFCVSARLGPTFVAILAYSTVILLIARPAMILYAYATTGNYRDILPSLLHTVMYCFLCSEYLSRLLRQRTTINSHKFEKAFVQQRCRYNVVTNV